MMEMATTFIGIVGGIGLVSFIIFAFRQGLKVRSRPEGVPPEQIPPV